MKKYLLLFIILLFTPLILTGCRGESENSNYNIEICYDNTTHSLSASEQVKYVNNSANTLNKICFHLYPNAFREEAKESPVSLANYSNAYPNGASYGSIEIVNVATGGEEVEYEISGEDCNILVIPLAEELFPQESVSLEIDFSVTLPNVNHRFGYGESTINLANFYPIACVYEDGKGFKQDLYTSNGDPFYSDIANYKVSIEYDKNLEIASTGDLVLSNEAEGTKQDTFVAEKVRDFAIVLSQDFKKEKQSSEGIEINYYYYNDETPLETLALSLKCMQFFSEKFGDYPYKQVSIVQSNFVYGGMEYPNLVMISDTLSTETAYYVIAHELAHQWWYGVVGNDEYNEAWVDEAITEYSTTLFFENHSEYGFDYKTLVTNANTAFKFYYDIYESVCDKVDTSMDRALNEFDTEPEYVHSVYTQGVIMYDSLRELIGEKKLYVVLRKYYEKMAYKNARGADLIAIFSNASGQNLESFFSSFLNGEALIK